MSERRILSTKNTPEFNIKPDGIIIIKGRSMGIGDMEINNKFESLLDSYLDEPADTTCVDINLEYLNSHDMKFYISFIRKLITICLKNKRLVINWYYENGDEDILEKGERISHELGFPFQYINIPEHRLL